MGKLATQAWKIPLRPFQKILARKSGSPVMTTALVHMSRYNNIAVTFVE